MVDPLEQLLSVERGGNLMVCLQCLVSLLQEVEALFKSENCPEALSAKFAHNSNWYITFQSDMDAQKVCVSFNGRFALISVVMGSFVSHCSEKFSCFVFFTLLSLRHSSISERK